MKINVIDIASNIRINDICASLIEPEHVVSVLKEVGFELFDEADSFAVYFYEPVNPSENLRAYVYAPYKKESIWKKRLSEVLKQIEKATGEPQLRSLCRMIKASGNECVIEI